MENKSETLVNHMKNEKSIFMDMEQEITDLETNLWILLDIALEDEAVLNFEEKIIYLAGTSLDRIRRIKNSYYKSWDGFFPKKEKNALSS